MDKLLLDRRTEMLRQHLMGLPLKLIVENLEGKYGTKAKQLYRDWERRNHWIPQVVRLNDPTLLHQLVQGVIEVLPALNLLVQQTENDFVKLGTLKAIADIHFKLLKVMQSIGVVEEKPAQVNLVNLNVGFEGDPELKRVLIEEAERQRRENEKRKGQQPQT